MSGLCTRPFWKRTLRATAAAAAHVFRLVLLVRLLTADLKKGKRRRERDEDFELSEHCYISRSKLTKFKASIKHFQTSSSTESCVSCFTRSSLAMRLPLQKM